MTPAAGSSADLASLTREPTLSPATKEDVDGERFAAAVDGDIAWAMAAECQKAGIRGQMQFHGAPKKAEKGVG